MTTTTDAPHSIGYEGGIVIDHPSLDRLIVRVTQLTEICVLANDPLTFSGGGSKSANKPESKSPGMQQCRATVTACERILTRTVRDLEAAYNAANPRERHEGASDYSDAEKDAARRVRAERSHLIAVRKDGKVAIDTE